MCVCVGVHACVRVCYSGGWYCFNKQMCDRRYEMMRTLMSSTNWPQTRTGKKTHTSSPLHFQYTLSLPLVNTCMNVFVQRFQNLCKAPQIPKTLLCWEKNTSTYWRRFMDLCFLFSFRLKSKSSQTGSFLPTIRDFLFVYDSCSVCTLLLL